MHEIGRMNGTSFIVIKQGCRRQINSTPRDNMLDIDVSLRHVLELSLASEDCACLRTLSSSYLTYTTTTYTIRGENKEEALVLDKNGSIPLLFREDFWYFDGLTPPGDNSSYTSSELNFDTLSRLLDQVTLCMYIR